VALFPSSKGTITSEDGFFVLKEIEESQDTLVVSFIGYKPFISSISNFMNGSYNIIDLEFIDQFLPTVQITSDKPLTISSNHQLSEYNINAQKISELPFVGAPDLFRLLQTLPGINSGNETSSELNIRGGRSDENLVLLDGFKLYNLDHFFGIFSTINPDIIKNARVYKSGFDASYGGRVSGVIDLSGKEGNNKKPAGSISLNTTNVNGLIETPLFSDKITLVTALRRAHSDLYQNPLYQNLFGSAFDTSANSQNQGLSFEGNEVPTFSFYDFYSKLSFRPNPENKFSLTFFRGQDNFSVTNESQRIFNFIEETDLNNYNFDWGNIGVGAIWTKKWSENVFTKTTFGKSSFNRNHHRTLELIDQNLITETSTSTSFSNSERSTLEDLTFSFSATIEESIGQRIKLGLESTLLSTVGVNNRQDTLPSLTSFYDESGTTNSVWGSYYREFDGFTIEVGSRVSFYSPTNTVYWSPRFKASRKLDDYFSVNVNAGRYFQFIRRTNRQNIFLNQPERWLIANNDSIPVLSSTQISGGISYRNKGWAFDFEGFIKNTSGNILNRNDVLLLELVQQTNAIAKGTANIGGLEFFLQKNKGRHTGSLSFTLSQALEFYDEQGNQINDGRPIFSPDNKTYDLKSTYQYNLTNWQFSTSFIWYSGTHYTPLLGLIPVTIPPGITFTKAEYGEEFSVQLKDYISLNLSCNYMKKFQEFDFFAGISISNILDRKNVKSLNYIPIFEERGELVDVEAQEIFLLGITPSINVKLSF